MKLKINLIPLVIFLIVISGISYFLYSQGILFDINSIINFTNSFGAFSYFIFFLIVLLEVIAAPIPGAILYTAGGILFGTFIGGTIALLANVIGAAIAFFIGNKIITQDDKKEKHRLNKALEKYGGYAIFLLRINPLTSSDIFSYLAGISKMDFKKFIIGTTLGLLPLIYIQAWLGGEILTNNKLLLNIFIIASIIYLLVFVYFLIRKGLLKWMKK